MFKKGNRIVSISLIFFCSMMFVGDEMPLMTSSQPLSEYIIELLTYYFSGIVPGFIVAVIIRTLAIFIYRASKKIVGLNFGQDIKIVDFQNQKYYFRDIIKQYEPICLNYLSKTAVTRYENLIIVLLTLRQKDVIEFNEEKIVVLNHKQKLTKIEKYVLKNIENGLINIDTVNEFDEMIINELINNKLAEETKGKGLGLGCWFIIITYGSFLISFIFHPAVYIFFICFPIHWFIVVGDLDASLPFKITKEGNKVIKQMKGLKNYIEDFTSLDEKEKEEIVIWEEYLIYSVIFGLNKKIVDDISKYIYRVEKDT